MPDINFDCPQCQQNIDAPEELAGVVVTCPTCNNKIEIPNRRKPPSPIRILNRRKLPSPIRVPNSQAPAEAAPAQQDIKFLMMECPLCNGHIEFPTHGIGQKVLCPHCQMDIVLCEENNPSNHNRDIETASKICGIAAVSNSSPWQDGYKYLGGLLAIVTIAWLTGYLFWYFGGKEAACYIWAAWILLISAALISVLLLTLVSWNSTLSGNLNMPTGTGTSTGCLGCLAVVLGPFIVLVLWGVLTMILADYLGVGIKEAAGWSNRGSGINYEKEIRDGVKAYDPDYKLTPADERLLRRTAEETEKQYP